MPPNLYTKPNSGLPPLFFADPNQAAELGMVPYEEPPPLPPAGPPPPPPPQPRILGPATPEQMAQLSQQPSVPPNPSGDPTEALKLAAQQVAGTPSEGGLQIPESLAEKRARFNRGLQDPKGPGAGDGAGAELRGVDLDLLPRGERRQRSAGYGPVRQVRPERMAEVGFSRAYAPGPDQADVDAYKGAVYNRLAGIAGAGAQQSGMMAEGINEQESFYKRQMDDLAIEQAKRAQLDTKLRTMQSEVELRRKEAERIQDPTSENFWKEKGVIGRVLGAVTMMIGGYLQGSGATADNEGTKLVDRAINGWIADQRTKYEKKDKQATEANNAYAEALARYGTPEAAEADMRMRGYAATVGLMQARARRVPVAEFQNAVQDAVNEGLVKVNEWQMNLSQLQTGQITEEHRLLPAQFAGGAPKADQYTVRLPNGDQGFTKPDAVENRTTQKRIELFNWTVGKMKEMDHLLSDSTIPVEKKAKRAASIAETVMKVRETAFEQGVVREAERPAALKNLGAAEDWTTLHGRERLHEQMKIDSELLKDTIRNHVFVDPGRTEYYLPAGPQGVERAD